MTHAEMVALIRGGVRGGGTWADLGAGGGNFTWALAELLGPGATIYAVDSAWSAIQALYRRLEDDAPPSSVRPLHGDLTQPLGLPPLDGILMANALHFQRDPGAVLQRLSGGLRPGGTLLLVEYEVAQPRPWIPYPVPFSRLRALAWDAGLLAPTRVGTRRSRTSGTAMYAAAILTAARSDGTRSP